MDNPGIYLVAWLLIAPIVGVIILSGLGKSHADTHTNLRRDNL
jgi:hypothetical protein